ncbi:MAG TPA: malonyl-CoA decarboxylase family protein [Candidatus Dormibacteraeota bacterium]|nr:malonyl-CoA decarboxylase family protein [Candidatus Dormibacteraeota bacterium]
MASFLDKLLKLLRTGRGKDMRFLCRHLLSQRGEASQTALAQEIINTYAAMDSTQRIRFYEMLCVEFSPDPKALQRAAANYLENPNELNLSQLSAAVEPPRQELLRRINTASRGTETLVAMRKDLSDLPTKSSDFGPLDADLRHLFRSWFNRGFLSLKSISWQTSALILEKLIRYESVHEINGWPDLRRRLQADRRCFAFFHPALVDEPVIFVEVALANGLTGDLERLLDVNAPVLTSDKVNTAIFYSINNCLDGLRGIPFGNFLIKQVVVELTAEFPNMKNFCTLSPLPRFSQALLDTHNEHGFTPRRLSALLADYAAALTKAGKRRDPVEAFFLLLEKPVANREVLAAPLSRLALAYLTEVRQNGKVFDPVAAFHLSNGARLEGINAFGNLRPYGLKASFGITINYRYVPEELEENHERFVTAGQIRISDALSREHAMVKKAWPQDHA